MTQKRDTDAVALTAKTPTEVRACCARITTQYGDVFAVFQPTPPRSTTQRTLQKKVSEWARTPDDELFSVLNTFPDATAEMVPIF